MKKMLVLLLLPLLLVVGVLGVNVLVSSFTANVNVTEPLVLISPTGTIDLDLFPGESEQIEIKVQNLASVSENVLIGDSTISNPNGVIYEVSYNTTFPESIPAITIDSTLATITVSGGSPAGIVSIAFNIERTL